MSATLPVVETWAKLALAATWQLMALALLALACERALRLREPRVRYALWCAALACPLLLAPMRLCMTGRQFVVSLPKPVSVAAQTWIAAAPNQTPSAPAASGDFSPRNPAAGGQLRWPAADLSTGLALAWLLGCGALAVRLAVGYGRLRRLARESSPVTDATALESLRDLCDEAGIRGPVELRSSVRVATATVCGVRRPTIIIARNWPAELERDELRALLAHEVAHVRQRDFLANLLQKAVEGCLFFHPATWLASRRITLAREEVCDAWAMSQGTGPGSYARSLTAAAEHAHTKLTVASVGIAEGRSALLRRVEVIMKGHATGRSSRLAGIVPVAVMVAVAAALALVQIGARQAAAQGGGGSEGGGGGGIHEPYQVDAPTSPPPTPEYTIADLDPSLVHSYQVNRGVVADFPDIEDMSTPEAAYATINRALARGDQGIWRRITADPEKLAGQPAADAPPKPVAPEVASHDLGCRVVEVWIYRGWHCLVIAEMPSPSRYVYDLRSLRLVDGEWLNLGNSAAENLELARSHFVRACLSYDRRDEKYYEALAHPELIVRMAQTLFEAIRGADYDYFLNSTKPDVWQEFPHPGEAGYMVHTDYPSWVAWVCTTFRRNPIGQVELGEVFEGEYGRPTIPYRLTLKDGAILSGDLPYMYSWLRGSDSWTAMEGLDWHLPDSG